MKTVAIAVLLLVTSAQAARADRLTDLMAYAIRGAAAAYAICKSYNHKNAIYVFVALDELFQLYKKASGKEAELAAHLGPMAPVVLPEPKQALSGAVRRRTLSLIRKSEVAASCNDAAAKEYFDAGSRYLSTVFKSMQAWKAADRKTNTK